MGDPGHGYSVPSGISADGRYVAFVSFASDLVAGDTNDAAELFLRDMQAGTTERIAVSGAGVQGDKGSGVGSLTPDARFACFDSESTNLVPGDTNGASDIFLRDRLLGTTERLSVDNGGEQANSTSYDADVSADGRYVVFASLADNLVPGDTNGQDDIFLRDRQAGTTTRLNLGDGQVQAGTSGSYNSQISNDGRYVSFDSGATNLVPGDTNGTWDVFLVDRGPAAPATPAFTDIASSPYKAAIESLAGAGIINGYQVGDSWEFRPGNNLKRAQFAKMIVGSWSYPVTEAHSHAPFTDLGADDPGDLYPHEYVGVAYQTGITKGTTATTFGPYVNITRAQLVTMVVRSMRAEDPEAVPAPPVGWIGTLPGSDPTHGANIRAAEYGGLLAGISLTGWDVWGDATRGETAQILYNMRGL